MVCDRWRGAGIRSVRGGGGGVGGVRVWMRRGSGLPCASLRRCRWGGGRVVCGVGVWGSWGVG